MAGATVVLAITAAAIWFLAVPLEPACPAGAGGAVACSSEDRRSAGLTWTSVLAGGYLVTVVLATTVGRRDRWAVRVPVWLLVGVAVVAYGAVQGSTGFVVP